MTTEEIKGRLIARKGNLEVQLRQQRQTVLLMEADLKRARGEADVLSGALQQVDLTLTELDEKP